MKASDGLRKWKKISFPEKFKAFNENLQSFEQ